jgi:transcription elongation GreA/GreB family factor
MGATKMIIYIGAALGSLNYQGQPIHIISAQSPLAIALKGHAEGDVVNFNQKKYKIEVLA